MAPSDGSYFSKGCTWQIKFAQLGLLGWVEGHVFAAKVR